MPTNQYLDQLLADAKGTLSKANKFSASLTRDVADEAAAPTAVDYDQPSIFDSATTKLGRFARNVVRPIPAAAEKAAMLGSFLAPEVAIPSQLVMGAMSGNRIREGGQKRINEHPYQSAGDALMLLPGAKALHGLMSGAKDAAPVAKAASRFGPGSASAFEDLAHVKGYSNSKLPASIRDFSSKYSHPDIGSPMNLAQGEANAARFNGPGLDKLARQAAAGKAAEGGAFESELNSRLAAQSPSTVNLTPGSHFSGPGMPLGARPLPAAGSLEAEIQSALEGLLGQSKRTKEVAGFNTPRFIQQLQDSLALAGQ